MPTSSSVDVGLPPVWPWALLGLLVVWPLLAVAAVARPVDGRPALRTALGAARLASPLGPAAVAALAGFTSLLYLQEIAHARAQPVFDPMMGGAFGFGMIGMNLAGGWALLVAWLAAEGASRKLRTALLALGVGIVLGLTGVWWAGIYVDALHGDGCVGSCAPWR